MIKKIYKVNGSYYVHAQVNNKNECTYELYDSNSLGLIETNSFYWGDGKELPISCFNVSDIMYQYSEEVEDYMGMLDKIYKANHMI